MTIIKTIHEAYDAPEIKYLEVRPEGVLCQSGNTFCIAVAAAQKADILDNTVLNIKRDLSGTGAAGTIGIGHKNQLLTL